MGIYKLQKAAQESDYTEDDIKKLIQENIINIVFGDFDEEDFEKINESFNIPVDKSNPSIYFYIRNKYIDGEGGNPINHYCTVKLIKNNEYIYNKHKGVPFRVNPIPALDVDYEINRKDKRITINFIKDNKDDILAYWNAKNDADGKRTMEEIENRICKKYGVKLNGKNK